MKTLSAREFSNGMTFKKIIIITYLYHVTVEIHKQQGKYFVRAFNHVTGSSVCDKLASDTFTRLSDANKRFYSLVKAYKPNEV